MFDDTAELQDIQNNKWIFDDTLLKLCEYYNINCIYIEKHSVRNVCHSDRNLSAALSHIKSGNDGSFFVPLLVHAVKKDFSGNNHYVGIFIKKDHNQYYVTYLDPMGHMINNVVRENLYNIFGRDIRLELYKGNIQFTTLVGDGDVAYYDGNKNDCGPILIYLVGLLANNKQLPLLNPIIHNLAECSRQVGKDLRDTILNDVKKTEQSLLTKEFDSLSISAYHVDEIITNTVAFPRCEYYTRFQGTTPYEMNNPGYWGTYFRSVKSRYVKTKHDKSKKFIEAESTLNKPGITPAKAGNFQSLFYFPKYQELVNYPTGVINAMQPGVINAMQPSSLYNAILQYKQSICAAVITETPELVLQNQITVVYANSYPCLMVHVPIPSTYKLARTTGIDNWAKIAMSCYVAATNRAAYELKVPIEIVIRSSFGHNIPSVSGTGTTFRINIGIVPQRYTEVLIEGIKKLDAMVTLLNDTKVIFREKEMELLECFNQIATLKKGKKQNRTETVLAELVRQRYYLDFIADKMAESVLNSEIMQNIWQELIDRITIREDDQSITFQLEKDKEFKLDEEQKGTFDLTEWDLGEDTEFWEILSLINTAFRSQDLQDIISRKSVNGLYKVLEKANLGIIKNAPQYEIEDGAGSDSGVEDGGRLYARKIVVTTGMKAINVAAFLVHAYCTSRSVSCNFDTEYMYYETGDALKFCNDFLSQVFNVPKTNVKISCIDLNYCSAGKDVNLPHDIFSTLSVGYPVIIDYTSATTQLINDATRKSLERASVVILLNSGLKNEQLGADINTYGTVRIVTSERYTLDMLYSLARESLLRTPSSMLPLTAHQIRKTYKDLGCTVTHRAIFENNQYNLKNLGALEHKAIQGHGYWDAIGSMSDLYGIGMAPKAIIDRLHDLQQLLALGLSRNIFWRMFSNIDFLSNVLLRECVDNDPQSFVNFIQGNEWARLEQFEEILTLEYLWENFLNDNSLISDEILCLCIRAPYNAEVIFEKAYLLDRYSIDEKDKDKVIMLLSEERGQERIETDGLDQVLLRLERLDINSDEDPLDALDYHDAMEGCPDEMFPRGSSDDEENYESQDYHNYGTGTEETDSTDYSDESDEEETDTSEHSSTSSLCGWFENYYYYLKSIGKDSIINNFGYEKVLQAFDKITNDEEVTDLLIKNLQSDDCELSRSSGTTTEAAFNPVLYFFTTHYNNPLLNYKHFGKILSEAQRVGGSDFVNRFMSLDVITARAVISVVETQGVDGLFAIGRSSNDTPQITGSKFVSHHSLSTLDSRQVSQDQDMVHVLHQGKSPTIHNMQHIFTNEGKILDLFWQYGIKMTLEEAMTDKGFRKVSLKLHPDKGGNKEDFQFYKDFRDKFNNHDAVEHTISSTETTIQKTCYFSSLTFKTLDVGINTVRVFHNPTPHNIADAIIGGAHLFSMVSGVTKFSTAAIVISVGYTCYEDGIYEWVKSAALSIVFIAAPSAIALASVPYVATAYTIILTGYTGYSLVNNAWSLYNELSMQDTTADNTEVQNAGMLNLEIGDS